jgi:hypothetical protein
MVDGLFTKCQYEYDIIIIIIVSNNDILSVVLIPNIILCMYQSRLRIISTILQNVILNGVLVLVFSYTSICSTEFKEMSAAEIYFTISTGECI